MCFNCRWSTQSRIKIFIVHVLIVIYNLFIWEKPCNLRSESSLSCSCRFVFPMLVLRIRGLYIHCIVLYCMVLLFIRKRKNEINIGNSVQSKYSHLKMYVSDNCLWSIDAISEQGLLVSTLVGLVGSSLI